MHQNHLEGLLNQTADQVCSGHNICIPNKFTDDADDAGPKAIHGEAEIYREQLKGVNNFRVLDSNS